MLGGAVVRRTKLLAGLVRAKCVVTIIKLCQDLQKREEVSGTEQVGVICTMF